MQEGHAIADAADTAGTRPMRRPGQSTGTVARVARASVSSGDCGRGFHVGQGSSSGSSTHEGAGGYAVRGSSSTTTGACTCSTAPRHRDHRGGLLTCNACACLSCDVEVWGGSVWGLLGSCFFANQFRSFPGKVRESCAPRRLVLFSTWSLSPRLQTARSGSQIARMTKCFDRTRY